MELARLVIISPAGCFHIGVSGGRSVKRPQEENWGESNAECVSWRTKSHEYSTANWQRSQGSWVSRFQCLWHLAGKIRTRTGAPASPGARSISESQKP